MVVSAGWVLALLCVIFLFRFRKRSLAAFNRAVTNRIARPLAGRLPGMGVVVHVGRRSGRTYRTPVMVFSRPDGFLVALTYGVSCEWLRNVLASGACTLETRGVAHRALSPVIVHDPTRRRFPVVVRAVLGLVGATDYVRLVPPAP
jgi:deazaflavin-dependent oxidoreductase (nitroreductase family)